MAVINQVLHRKNSSGTYDTVYFQTNLANVTGTLAVGHGGTGKSTLTAGSYLIGAGSNAVSLKSPSQVLSDIGAAASGHTHSAATVNTDGFMSKTDKSKLDGIEDGANAYTHPSSKQCSYSYSLPTASANTLGGIKVGTNLTISSNGVLSATNTTYTHPSTKQCDAAAGNHTHSAATTSAAGFMSKDDKSKLDGIAAGANKYTHPSTKQCDAAAGSHTHTKNNITDFPASMPASDVYSWAKASSKPTYTASEVGAAASSHDHDASAIKVTANTSYTSLFPRGQSLFADSATVSGLVNGAIAWLYS